MVTTSRVVKNVQLWRGCCNHTSFIRTGQHFHKEEQRTALKLFSNPGWQEISKTELRVTSGSDAGEVCALTEKDVANLAVV